LTPFSGASASFSLGARLTISLGASVSFSPGAHLTTSLKASASFSPAPATALTTTTAITGNTLNIR